MFLLVLLWCNREAVAKEFTAVIAKDSGEEEVWGVIRNADDKHVPVIARVKAGERFIAVEPQPGDEFSEVYLQSGVSGWMPTSKIKFLRDAPILKLNFRKSEMLQWARQEPAEATRRANIDYVARVRTAMTGDPGALEKFFYCGKFMDGAAAELHDDIVWGVFHIAGDASFDRFLRTAPPSTRDIVKDYLASPNVTWPISEPIPYLRNYFPKTYRALFSGDS